MLLGLQYALKNQGSKMWTELDWCNAIDICVHDNEVNDS